MAKAPAKTPPKRTRAPVRRVFAFASHGLTPIGERSTNDAGEPVQRFRARLLRPGRFTHPKAGWKLDVDDARRDGYMKAAQEMLAAGVAIPFTSEHFTADARNTLGYADAVAVHDDWLTAEGEFIGDDAIRAAMRNCVSVEIEENVGDGEGNRFGEAITRIALTPSPIVKGQTKIAASTATGRPSSARVYFLSDEDHDMDFITKLTELTGLKDLSEENWAEQVKAHLEGMGDTSKLQEQITALTAERDKFKTAAEAKPADDKPAVDEDVIEERAETTQERLDSLVTAGKITPAVSDKLAASLIGPEGNRNVIALSRTAAKHAGLPGAFAKPILDALAENDPVKLKAQTGPQRIALSREDPGAESAYDPAVTREMVEMAGGPAAKK